MIVQIIEQSSQSPTFSTFLSLPAELRQPVYTHLLTLPTHIPSNSFLSSAITSFHTPFPTLDHDAHRAAILVVCRLTHAEAHHLLYTLNTFVANPTILAQLPHYFLWPTKPIITPRLTKLIKRWTVNVRLDVDPRFTEEQATEAFTGADELTVDCTEAMFRSAGCGVVMLFRGVRGVGRARVKGGGVDEGVRAWLEEVMMSPVGEKREVDGWKERVVGDDVWATRGLDTVGIVTGANGGASAGEVYDLWVHGNR